MKDPNNIRNRWRRYREACIAYGWAWSHFRDHAGYLWSNPKSYAAKASDRNFTVALVASRDGVLLHNRKESING